MPTTTTYSVYRANGEGGIVLSLVAETEAINDQKAIASVVGDAPEYNYYVAIPVRNLRVREVVVETNPKVVIK